MRWSVVIQVKRELLSRFGDEIGGSHVTGLE